MVGDAEKGTKTERTPLIVAPTEVETPTNIEDERKHHHHHHHRLVEDVLDTFKLGIPIFIAMLSWVGVSAGMFGKYSPFIF